MLNEMDLIFVAWLMFSALSLVYLHKRNRKQAVKAKAQNKMCDDFENFLDGGKK